MFEVKNELPKDVKVPAQGSVLKKRCVTTLFRVWKPYFVDKTIRALVDTFLSVQGLIKASTGGEKGD